MNNINPLVYGPYEPYVGYNDNVILTYRASHSDNIETERFLFNICNKYDEKLFAYIKDRYNEIHRFYHNLNHIHHLILLADTFDLTSNDRNNLTLAILFHDFVYTPLDKYNEEESVNSFLNYFYNKVKDKSRFDCIDIETVKSLIMTTKQSFISKYEYYLNTIMFTIDYSIVRNCSDKEILIDYENNICSEFLPFCDEKRYYEGRRRFIAGELKYNSSLQVLIDYIDEKYKSSTL